MISRRAAVAAGCAVLLASGGVYYGLSRPNDTAPVDARPAQRAAIDAVPKGATLVVTVDLAALRAAPLAAPYLAGDRTIEGLGRIRDACGFDPLALVGDLVIAVPEAYDADFGIAATGTFGDGPVVDCATRVIAARGGKPVTSSIGSFRAVRDLDAPTTGEIAVRPGGPLLFGGGGYLRAMVDALDGTLPALGPDDTHRTLRAKLAGHETIQATLVLSKKQRDVIAEELGAAGGAAPPAIGAIAAAALGVSLAGERAKVRLVVRCDDPAGAAQIVALIDEASKDAAKSAQAAVLGAESLLRRMTVTSDGAEVVVSVDAGVEEIETIVDRAMAVRALLDGQRAPAPSPIAPPEPSAAPSASASAGAPQKTPK